MYSIIGGDGKPYGPVSYSMLQRWKAEGRINDETLTCREGETEWHPLREVMAQAAAEEVTLPPPPSDILPGIPDPHSEYSQQSEPSAEFVISDQKLRIMDALERAWAVYKGAFWPILGASLLVQLISTAISMVPVIGPVINLVLIGVFTGGIQFYVLKHFRGEKPELSEAFSGFSKASPLIVTALWVMLIAFLTAIPATLIIGAAVYPLMDAIEHYNILAIAGLVILGCIIFLPACYIMTCYSFCFLLVMDQNLSGREALALSRKILHRSWIAYSGLLLLVGLLIMLGLLAFFVGAIFLFPMTYCATVAAYEQLCLTHRKD